MVALTMPALDAAETSFDRHIRAVTLRHSELLLWMFIACLVSMWPGDAVLFAGRPELIADSAMWRATLVAINVLGLMTARRLRRSPALTFPIVTLFAALNAAALGRWLSVAGGTDAAWFYASYAVPLAVLPLLLPLAQRIVVTTGVLGACATAYLVGDSSGRAGELVGASMVTLAAVGAMSVALGHLYFRLVRTGWDQHLALRDRVAERGAQVRALLGHVERAELDERRRIGRELHDELAQKLTILRLEVSYALRTAGDAVVVERLHRIDQVVDELVDAKQRLVAGLRPARLDQVGFAAAVTMHARDVAARTNLTLALEVDASTLADDHPATAVAYRALQEALTNVARHASAREVTVSVVVEREHLELRVADDGRGFDPAALNGCGFGLAGLRERVAALGGEVAVDSAPGRGTLLSVSLPLS
jgi:signal transduction histidine kinase